MEFYKNLYPYRESKKIQLVFGFIFIILSILWILQKKHFNSQIFVFDWLYSIIFLLNGIVVILQYYGIHIEEIFGKRYIKITPEEIDYKPKTFNPAKKIKWVDVKVINFKVNSIELESIKGENIVINYTNLEYASVQELKERIAQITQNKNCNIIS